MSAAVLYGQNDIRWEKVELPEPGDSEIVVKVRATGICGSDLPRVLGKAAHHYPIILGHEFAGIVETTGKSVTRVKPGDRVAGAPLLPCHACKECSSGLFAQCRSYSFIGSRTNGSWAEYVVLPERNAIPVPEGISLEEAALFEPSAVALHALQLAGFGGGANVAVLGGGNIGLLVLQWARILGAGSVTVFDLEEERLARARSLGADNTVLSLAGESFKESLTLTGGRGFDFVLETAGSTVTINACFELAAPRGSVCFVGTPTRDLLIPFQRFEKLNRKELRMTGSWMSYSDPFPGTEWKMTAREAAAGRLNLRGIVHHKLPLSRIAEAFEAYRDGEVKGKILLLPQE
jgi:L-iditol 2-dehydrogenase